MAFNEMKYVTAEVTFEEIPDEVCLTIAISGCPRNCKNCHSPHLREDIGTELTESTLKELVEDKGKHCTCVCFLGGDQHYKELRDALFLCKTLGKKTALYTGANDVSFSHYVYLNYMKCGEYIEELGALDSETTNQKLFRNNGNGLTDITYKFWGNR